MKKILIVVASCILSVKNIECAYNPIDQKVDHASLAEKKATLSFVACGLAGALVGDFYGSHPKTDPKNFSVGALGVFCCCLSCKLAHQALKYEQQALADIKSSNKSSMKRD